MRLSRRLIREEKGGPALRAQADSQPEVRYLTLPGIDYLDVRQLADSCRELDCCLTSIGFQSGGEGNSHVARAQVREKALIDAGHITKHSYTFARRFQDVINLDGQVYEDLRGRGPFHIVNIDACGSIAAPAARHAERLVDALFRIVELQLEFMSGRWLLFVTTHAQPDSVAQETLDRFCKIIVENAETNDAFRRQAALLLGSEQTGIRAAARVAAERPGIDFLQLFALGLAKWLLALVKKKGGDMKTHHPYCYSTALQHDDAPSMACLAFEFLPPYPGLDDRHRVTRAEPKPASRRKDTAVRAARKVAKMANADESVRSDELLRERLTDDLRRLLEEAGYEPKALAQLGALGS